MTDLHAWVLFVHLLGWVFWLGTDVGVLLAAKRSEQGSLSRETRLSLVSLALVLDRAPRLAVPIVFGTGVQLSADLGHTLLPAQAGWAIAAVWALIVATGIRFGWGETRIGGLAMTAQLGMNGVVAVGMGGLGLASLSGLLVDVMPVWLAAKWLAYGVIAAAAIWLEGTFAKAAAFYAQLAERGGDPAFDAALSAALQPVYRCVYVIYAATLVAAFSGIAKM